MRLPYAHELDDEAYAADHPEVPREELYEHFVARCPAADVERYRYSQLAPTVSVVIPAYNSAQWLDATLESVRKQTFAGWECLIVDDFSTDRTTSVARRFYHRDKRFRLVAHRANGGASAARNSGLRSARGAYLCFLDADDLLSPTSLENRLRALVAADNERLGGSYSGSVRIDPETRKPPAETRAAPRIIDFVSAGGMCPFNMNQPMFKTAVLRQLGGFDETLSQAEDWEYWMRLLRHGYYLVPTGKTDVTYRARSGSMVRAEPLNHLRTGLAIYNGAHAPYPEERVVEGAPYVYWRPWIDYKRQLEMAQRVFEFTGMAIGGGAPADEAVEVAKEALPDYLGALAGHRNIASLLERGVRRQLGHEDRNATGRHGARMLEEKFREGFRESGQAHGPQASDAAFPSDFGPVPARQHEVDVIFLPHKDYHVWSIAGLAPALEEAGVSYACVDLSYVYRDERARGKLEELGMPRVSYNTFLLGEFRPKMIVCMNDWDPITRRLVECGKALGIPTVGIVEGIQDYRDVDTGRLRAPYQIVDHVILPGAFDARYFDATTSVHVAGVPRIDDLLEEAPRPLPERPRVVINSNFTYGVLTDARDEWVRTAVAACQAIGVDYVISRHPADEGDFSDYELGEESMYDLLRGGSAFISRFSSGILEALALGRPPVYYNPHGEKVDKFTEPGGAFPIATSQGELEAALRDVLDEPERFLAHADAYLELHCGVSRSNAGAAAEKTSRALLEIYEQASCPDEETRSRLRYLMIQRDEALLGPPAPKGAWNRRAIGHVGVLRGGEAARGHVGESRRDVFARKLRKFQSDPKRFFEDSSVAPLRALGRLFR